MIEKIVGLLNSGKSGKVGSYEVKHLNRRDVRYSYVYNDGTKILSAKYTTFGLFKALALVDYNVTRDIIKLLKEPKSPEKVIDCDEIISAFVGQSAYKDEYYTVATKSLLSEYNVTFTSLYYKNNLMALVISTNTYTQFNMYCKNSQNPLFMERLLSTILPPNEYKKLLNEKFDCVRTFNSAIFVGGIAETLISMTKTREDFIASQVKKATKEEARERKSSELEPNQKQSHYPEEESLILISDTIGLNGWEFDVFKRLYRCRKKGEFAKDLGKILDTIDLYISEYERIKDLKNGTISEFLRLNSSFSLSNKLGLNCWESNIFALICQCRVSGHLETDLNKAKITVKNYLREYSPTK